MVVFRISVYGSVCRSIIFYTTTVTDLMALLFHFLGSDWRLLVISKQTLLGCFPGSDGKFDVYRIDRIAVLPLSSGELTEVELEVHIEF